MKIHCLVPARIGSNRLKKKNLLEISGESLVTRALKKCVEVNLFDEVVLNSDSELILQEADGLDVIKYMRPEELGGDNSTSEDYIYDYFSKTNCDAIVQVHAIAPLLGIQSIRGFVQEFRKGEVDVLISSNEEWLEYAFQNKPLNFTFKRKENSQDLEKLTKLNWAMSAWKRDAFIAGYFDINKCGTYNGNVGFYNIPSHESIMIKEEFDFKLVKTIVENGL